MQFRIADTFTDSLARLTRDEQKLAKTTAFDLQVSPENSGMSFHKLDRARDKHFWSVRVGSDLRIIVHRTDDSLMLCYVDHHDRAYDWAERRKLEVHPQTGAAQLVEIRERTEEILIRKPVEAPLTEPESPRLFNRISRENLLQYGVPEEWLDAVLEATEETILELADHLPGEAAEAVLDLAVGRTPLLPQPRIPSENPFDHPDSQRRFRIVDNQEELAMALEFPWEKWTIFLHPAQRRLVEGEYSGPLRVAGSAGTGKTIVALHRAVFLTRQNPEARVLLTTFSDALANALKRKMRELLWSQPKLAERLDIQSLDAVGRKLFEVHLGKIKIASSETINQLISEASAQTPDQKFSLAFLRSEWEQVVDAWQLTSWEEYRDVLRLGRKTRLSEKQRKQLWSIFSLVRSNLEKLGQITMPDMFGRLTILYAGEQHSPYEFYIIDEAQDIEIGQLRFLSALCGDRENGLFFTGDLGQRIFQTPFSWKAAGVDVRGRSKTLRINYRTSHQIRAQADRLLDPEFSDVDGNTESRRDAQSMFNGPDPVIFMAHSPADEIEKVGEWLRERTNEKIAAHEIAIFVRSAAEMDRAIAATTKASLSYQILDKRLEIAADKLSLATMHLAKGLEFRAVAVMACDEEIIPMQSRLSAAGESADLEEIYNTERQLLYVAITRARDHLLVSSGMKPSEFLDDLQGK
jgi:hypothetical protein